MLSFPSVSAPQVWRPCDPSPTGSTLTMPCCQRRQSLLSVRTRCGPSYSSLSRTKTCGQADRETSKLRLAFGLTLRSFPLRCSTVFRRSVTLDIYFDACSLCSALLQWALKRSMLFKFA